MKKPAYRYKYPHKQKHYNFGGESHYACENCSATTVDGGLAWNAGCALTKLVGVTYADSTGVLYGGESGEVVLATPTGVVEVDGPLKKSKKKGMKK